MDTIISYLSAHPAMLSMIVIFIVIIILYFIIKQFIKLAIVLVIVALALGTYYYFQDPGKLSEKIKKSIDTMKTGPSEVMEKSKNLYKDSKDLINKTKELPSDVNKLFKGDE